MMLRTISQEESRTLSTGQAQLMARAGQAHSLELKGRDGTSCGCTHRHKVAVSECKVVRCRQYVARARS